MLASSGKSDVEAETGVAPDFPCGPARGMAFVRCAHVPVASSEGFLFFRPPGVLLPKPGGQKIAWAFVGLSHPGLEFSSFSGGALWHTRSTRQRDERQYS